MKQAWPQVPLGEVLTHSQDYIDTPEPRTYAKLSVRLYGKGVVLDTPADGASLKMKRHQIAKAGQVILSEIWGKKGAIGFVPDDGEGALCTSHFFLFDVHRERIEPKYLQAIFTANYLQGQLDSEAKGTTGYAAVRPKHLLAASIPLPAVNEQRRIVARIEELSAKVEEVRRIRREATSAAEAMVACARNEVVARLRAHTRDMKLGEVCQKITDGPHVSPRYVESGVPFISVRNISEQGLDFSTAKYITSEDHAAYSAKANVEFGDVLYTKGGTTGVARRVDVRIPFSIWVHVALLKLRRDRVEPGFVEHMLNAPSSKGQAEELTHGSSNRDLGLTRMCNIVFPIPDLRVQRSIVTYLDGLLTRVDTLNKVQEETAKELDALMPSILSKAFAGEL